MTATEHDEATPPSATVAARVRSRLDSLSPGERKVARALLSSYPVAGLETVAELAKRASVSSPTVVRFVSRLGFSGHAEFQKALMREVHESQGSPLQQYGKAAALPANDFLGHMSQAFSTSVETTFSELPDPEFSAATDLLCDDRRRLHLVGGRFSHVLADYLRLHLEMVRHHVHPVPADELSRLSIVASASKADVVIAFDYRRYDQETVRFVQNMASRGSSIVLLTDSWLSPASEVAAVVLPARVEAPSPFDSLTAAMAVVESLVAAVADRYGEQGRRRIETIEQFRQS
ncbi:MurR/RpiR family transcriptional regulator [Aeromicrobium endophyticum]|uniref:MurR/RpiR family transcriptional regulator n=1 Tax=Aeromicrobium endophyticum TaxID=2292704 RepID=A0A371P604_9ACTN|nr:MurR/RpiR family transcriptional regulator [Aeromicrobium endophyticum]REK70960.1 MurR/RpiR family transcriptional regulator [Aeromicrobium endophyticum]